MRSIASPAPNTPAANRAAVNRPATQLSAALAGRAARATPAGPPDALGAAPAGRAARATPAGPRDALDRLRARERIESIARLRAAACALGAVDVSGWDDATLTDHLDDLSKVLCALDAELARVADAVRARGFRIEEPKAA